MKTLRFGLLAFALSITLFGATSCSTSVDNILEQEEISEKDADILLNEYNGIVTDYVLSIKSDNSLSEKEAIEMENKLAKAERIEEKLDDAELTRAQKKRLRAANEKMSNATMNIIEENAEQFRETMKIIEDLDND